MIRLLALLCITTALLLAAGRGVLPEDYLAYEFSSDPHIAPGGSQVAYVVATIDSKANRRRSSIWLSSLDGGVPRALTGSAFSSNAPRWSPDGKTLAFLSNRGAPAASAQIWILRMDGGEAQAAHHPEERREFIPMVTRRQAIRRRQPHRAERPGGINGSKNRRPPLHAYFVQVQRHGLVDDKRSHLFVVDANAGADKQLTTGEEWNDTDPQWSPDSTRIAFVSDRTGNSTTAATTKMSG